jgi:NAD(P)H-dependent flavin oxidoreductase YrpB (nitropropane dioxygenase family)
MGVAVSHWPLARAVASAGQLGVVSGVGIDTVFVRRLQDRGVDDELQSVLDRFPCPSVVEEVVAKFGTTRRPEWKQYRGVPMLSHRTVQSSQDLNVLAAYAEVAQAKAGHDGLVGINLLTKVQIPTVPILFGAMLAGVDYVQMGAGIPVEIPGILDRLAQGELVETQLNVTGNASAPHVPVLRFDPERLTPHRALRRPRFLAIVSSHVLAKTLARRSTGKVDGFVVESPVAGGHNAPPRGPLTLDDDGSPIYGDRDRVDFAAIKDLGVPFWIGGGVTSPQRVREAFDLGAAGVQVGTLFAYCRESGMDPPLKEKVIAAARNGSVRVMTSARASSTGYPFKVACVDGTLSDKEVYARRRRVCDLSYLREAYLKADETVGYRCPGEPVESYLAKGGRREDTVDRVCLCNALASTAGFGQVRRESFREPPIVTSGDCVNDIALLLGGKSDYSAADVIAYLQNDWASGSY